MVGVPMDLGVTNRWLAVRPAALRTPSGSGPTTMCSTVRVQDLRVADIGDVRRAATARFQPRGHRAPHARSLRAASCRVGRRRPFDQPSDPARGRPAASVGMIHIDAHCDTGGAYDSPSYRRSVSQRGARRRAHPLAPSDRNSRFGRISLGVHRRVRHDGHAEDVGGMGTGHHREGEEDRRRRADLRPSYRQPDPPSRRHRTPEVGG